MRLLLAIFILSLGWQPMPLQACDGMADPPPAHHAGHGDGADTTGGGDADMGCCADHGMDDAPACQADADCHHCLAGAPAMALPVQGIILRPLVLAPGSADEGLPGRITSSPYKPPIS